jgi:hypothetical protein
MASRTPLMVDVILCLVIEVASGLAPTYGWFLFFRAIYGIGCLPGCSSESSTAACCGREARIRLLPAP